MKSKKVLIFAICSIYLLTLTACSEKASMTSTEEPVHVQVEAGTPPSPSEGTDASTPQESVDPNALEADFLFENSDKIKLKAEDLAGYDQLMLRIGVNEIYARKGFPFKDAYWKQYFESQSWYKVDENFSETNFSDVEKANLAFLKNQKVMLSMDTLDVDFDGDGIKEHIAVDASIMTKLIDSEEKWYPWDDSYMGALVTDIDITDGERELLLYDAGPSADFTTALCRYNPKTQDWTLISAQSRTYFDHESDGKGHIKLETFQNDIFETGLYEYKQGKLILTEVTYPNYTLSKTLGTLPKGTTVTIEPIEAHPEKGEKAALKIIEAAHPENSEIVYTKEETPPEFGLYFSLMQEYFDEVTEMYYGD